MKCDGCDNKAVQHLDIYGGHFYRCEEHKMDGMRHMEVGVKLKRFLIFCGRQFKKGNGWLHFQDSCHYKIVAVIMARSICMKFDMPETWWQVVDTKNGIVVADSETDVYGYDDEELI